jgi:putative NIF3 family GTP cyclohydrolase 1 type 2
MDETEWCKEDSVYLAKKKLIEDNNITIWRFHDHMHFGSNVDYIYKGMIKELGWQEYLQPDEKEPWVYQIPETTLKALSDTLMKKFEMDVIQTIGNPDCKINRVGLLVGGGSLGLGREMMPMEVMERNNLNVLICGDITEWTTCAYINDAKQLGFDRSMITLGHERSEEAGMKYLAPWLKEHVNVLEDMKVEFICAKEPFVYYKNSGRNMSVYRINYSSEALCRNVDINVIVPFEAPGMPQLLDTKPKKFKTLYLLHGFGGNQNDWLDYTAIRDIAEQNNIAVVMPAGENSWYVDTGVFGAQYGTYFGKELVEYTRKAFPLSDKREDTFIGGFSMGGFGALRLGSFYHELYSKVFTFSAAFIIDNI